MKTTRDCDKFRAEMPDLLLESSLVGQAFSRAHLADCAACNMEWREMQATVSLLEEWQVPEPSPYFDSRLHVRLREELNAPPEGVFERLRSFVLFSTGRQLRPALAGALGLVLLVGGGSGLIGLREHLAHERGSSATLNDLNVLDNNAQALQQMDQLLDDNGSDEGGAAPVT